MGCWPAGPIRPPGPWCLGPAKGSLDPRWAARQGWFREGSKLVSTVFRIQVTFGIVGCWPAGPIRPPGPWCLGPAKGSLDPRRAALQGWFREGSKLVSTVFRR